MPMYQYLAALYATPPSGGVRFVFFAIPTGLGLRVFAFFAHTGRSLSRLQHGLFFAASPCGEAPDLACLTAGWLAVLANTLNREPPGEPNQEPRRMARRHMVAHGGAAARRNHGTREKINTNPTAWWGGIMPCQKEMLRRKIHTLEVLSVSRAG